MLKKNNRRKSQSRERRHQKGQVLIIVVFAITALVAFVGLVIDLGLVFIQYGRLRRSVDAAALSASLQYRENYTLDSLKLAAEEFLVLNGINDPTAEVTVCDLNGDEVADQPGEELALCDKNGDGFMLSVDGEQRKFVHVIASSNVQLAFLPVIGIQTVNLAAEAISEAASLDVVLVLDRSESMTHDAPLFPANDPMRDPRQCNAVDAGGGWVGACSPIDDVKSAAYDFVNNYMFFPYDRVAIVTFDRNIHDGDDETFPGLHLTNDKNQILTRIKQLTVFDPQWNQPDDATLLADPTTAYLGGCEFFYDVDGPCRFYDLGTQQFVAFDCKSLHDGDPSPCTTSNIGGGLLAAGNEFALVGSRPEALWVVILLTDALANSSVDIANGTDSNVHCPGSTHTQPYCNDGIAAERHCQNIAGNENCVAEGGVVDTTPDDGINDYDADDFARDMGDFVGIGQQAMIFTIGLGNLVINCTTCTDPDTGKQLLEYIAVEAGSGQYFFAPTGDDLQEIFRDIADNIAVRLTH